MKLKSVLNEANRTKYCCNRWILDERKYGECRDTTFSLAQLSKSSTTTTTITFTTTSTTTTTTTSSSNNSSNMSYVLKLLSKQYLSIPFKNLEVLLTTLYLQQQQQQQQQPGWFGRPCRWNSCWKCPGPAGRKPCQVVRPKPLWYYGSGPAWSPSLWRSRTGDLLS